jgi:hypothetical protein
MGRDQQVKKGINMRLLKAIITGFGVLCGLFFGFIPACGGAVCLDNDILIIKIAAERNGIKYGSDDWYLLLAIRKAENGSKYQFGVINEKANTLMFQAAWCAATIMHHHKRFGSNKVTPEYIESLGDWYCPKATDLIGNKNWKRNVNYWLKKLKEIQNDNN